MAEAAAENDQSSDLKQWVQSVIDFSSEYDTMSWPASQVVGPPRVYPQYGDIAGAWAPDDLNASQFIEVQYETPVYVTGIDIYETYHGGAVSNISVMDQKGQWRNIWKTPGLENIQVSRILSPQIKEFSFKTNRVRLDINCTRCGTWIEIDAIQIRGNESLFREPGKEKRHPSPEFQVLVNNEKFSDVQFLVQDKLIFAHRNIISVRSQYFHAMFYSDMRESDHSVVIDLPDQDYDVFLNCLQYLYTNDVPEGLSPISMVRLLQVGDLYCLDGLKSLVVNKLSDALKIDNVVDVYMETRRLPSQETTGPVVKLLEAFISENFADLSQSGSFCSLPRDIMLEIVQMVAANITIK